MKKASDFADAHLRVFERPPLPDPDEIRSIYFIGICGTGMGSLAGLFRQAGYDVSGSDANAYPPMSTRLRELGIDVLEGYDAANLDRRPDLVIVGNACTPTHPEASRARDQSMHQLSLPEAFARFFIRDRRSLVVAGTHGKTTTSGLLVHTIKSVGLDPTYLVGGVMLNGETSFGTGSGRHAIVEGDEYDSAYFDKQPKFMHYRPATAIVTSVEFDHADIYEDWDDYRGAFERFAATVPADGALILNADSEPAMGLAEHAAARVVTYGFQRNAQVSARDVSVGPDGISYELVVDGNDAGRFLLPMTGRHNLSNALAVTAVCLDEGIDAREVAEAFRAFHGLKRRQEVLGEIDDVVIIDDFAHHPTAAAATIEGVRERWPDRRLVAVFEPRSNSSRRQIFEASYVDAFASAHVAVFSAPPFRHNDDARDFMDVNRMCRQLEERGVGAIAAPDHETLRRFLRADVRPGDTVLIMSNGGFGGLHAWLVDELSSRSTGTTAKAPSLRRGDNDGRALTLCREAIIVDGHLDVPHRVLYEIREDVGERTQHGDFDAVRARAGGLDAAFMVAYVPADLQGTGRERDRADAMIDWVCALIRDHPSHFAAAFSPADIRRNHARGLISLPIAVENGAALCEDVANVAYLYDRGVRYMTLTHAKCNALCDASYDEERVWGGLSPFGRDVVAEMNRLGMIVDVSHVSDEAFDQIVQWSAAPVVATHSSMRIYTPGWERNMSDAMLETLSASGGMVMINFGSSFLSNESRQESNARRAKVRAKIERSGLKESDPEAERVIAAARRANPVGTVDDVVRHIDHAVTIAGIEHVGIGSDFDGVFSLPAGLQDVSGYPNLVAGLIRAGYGDGDIRKILGENFLRVWDRVRAMRDER